MTLSASILDDYLGKHIKEICKNGFDKDSDNHCSHFVGHVLGIQIGLTCFGMTGKGDKHDRSSIRVQEVFARCPQVGKWDDKPATVSQCLAFVTAKSHVNLEKKIMENVPKKHIGIFIGGQIYHYSNRNHKVVQQSPLQFKKHYAGNNIEVFFGTFPA